MSAEPLPGIERLPRLTAGFARDFREAGYALAREALEEILTDASRPILVPLMRNITFAWKLRIARSDKRLVFLFIRRRSPTEVVIAAKLRLRFDLMPPDLPPDSGARPAHVEFAFAPPPWMRTQPGEAERRRYTMGAGGGDILLLGDPDGGRVLALGGLEREVPDVFFTDASGATTRIRPNGDGAWPLGPFLWAVGEIARWVRGGGHRRRTATVPLVVREDGSDVARVLHYLARASLDAAAVVTSTPARTPFAFEHVSPAYGLTSSGADVSLRLADDGQLALEFERNSFQLHMTLESRLRGRTLATLVTLGIPDFLVTGEVLDEIVSVLRAECEWDKLSRDLHDRLGDADLMRLLEDQRTRRLAFRIERKQKRNGTRLDTDVVALRGAVGRREALLIARLKLKVRPGDGSPRFEPHGVDPVDVIHFGFVDGGDDVTVDGHLDRDTVDYFFRLARSLDNWVGMLT